MESTLKEKKMKKRKKHNPVKMKNLKSAVLFGAILFSGIFFGAISIARMAGQLTAQVFFQILAYAIPISILGFLINWSVHKGSLKLWGSYVGLILLIVIIGIGIFLDVEWMRFGLMIPAGLTGFLIGFIIHKNID